MPPLPKDNVWFNRAAVAATIVLTLFLAVQAVKGLAETQQVGYAPRVPNTFSVEGYGKVSGKPTLAEVSLGLYSEGREVPTVQEANTNKVNAIIEAMKQMGISSDDLQTANYNISPKFDYTNGNPVVTGYTVSQSVSVKVRNLSQVGAVLGKAGELGANQVNGVTFTIDDPSQLQREARKEAIDDAQAKAEELADMLGLRVVRITTFSESSNGGAPSPMLYRADVANQKAVPDVQPGSLDVESRVSVTFEIR